MRKETDWDNTFLEALFQPDFRDQKHKEKIIKVLKENDFYYSDYDRSFRREIVCEGYHNVIGLDSYILHQNPGYAPTAIRETVAKQERNVCDYFKSRIMVVKH